MIQKIIFLLFVILSLSCTKEDIVLSEILRTNSSMKKENTEKFILIGDSNVASIKVSSGFSKLDVKVGPNKVGITTKGLSEILRKNSIDESVKIVFVVIGTNDAYKTDDSKILMSSIRKIYPNTEDVWVIWGSIGWGSNKRISYNQVKSFYDKFNKNGFRVIEIQNNYFSNDTDAHRPNTKYQKEIIQKMGDVLGK